MTGYIDHDARCGHRGITGESIDGEGGCGAQKAARDTKAERHFVKISNPRLGWKLRWPNCHHQLSWTDVH